MAKVTIRKKPITGGRQTLYLDYYPPVPHPGTGKLVRREYLKVYLFEKPRVELEREHNRETLKLVENLRAMRQIEVQNKRFGFISDEVRNGNFVDFFTLLARSKGDTNADNWKMSARYFKSFAGEQVRFVELNEFYCERYREFLRNAPALGRKGKTISVNTSVSYFNKFKAALGVAFRSGLLTEDLADKIDGIKIQDTHREFLEIDELQKLFETDCPSSTVKKAALFAAFSGLRFSDIQKLTWREIRGETGKFNIKYTQQKTTGAEYLPISDQAVELLGQRGEPDEAVFPDLKYSHVDQYIPKWVSKAKLDKHITFHSFRHTYATLQLAAGTDIYTVSKLLGHKHVKTTQIYTKVVDQKKTDAAKRIVLKMDSDPNADQIKPITDSD